MTRRKPIAARERVLNYLAYLPLIRLYYVSPFRASAYCVKWAVQTVSAAGTGCGTHVIDRARHASRARRAAAPGACLRELLIASVGTSCMQCNIRQWSFASIILARSSHKCFWALGTKRERLAAAQYAICNVMYLGVRTYEKFNLSSEGTQLWWGYIAFAQAVSTRAMLANRNHFNTNKSILT